MREPLGEINKTFILNIILADAIEASYPQVVINQKQCPYFIGSHIHAF